MEDARLAHPAWQSPSLHSPLSKPPSACARVPLWLGTSNLTVRCSCVGGRQLVGWVGCSSRLALPLLLLSLSSASRSPCAFARTIPHLRDRFPAPVEISNPHHPTGREKMGSFTLQPLQDPILLLPWSVFDPSGGARGLLSRCRGFFRSLPLTLCVRGAGWWCRAAAVHPGRGAGG